MTDKPKPATCLTHKKLPEFEPIVKALEAIQLSTPERTPVNVDEVLPGTRYCGPDPGPWALTEDELTLCRQLVAIVTYVPKVGERLCLPDGVMELGICTPDTRGQAPGSVITERLMEPERHSGVFVQTLRGEATAFVTYVRKDGGPGDRPLVTEVSLPEGKSMIVAQSPESLPDGIEAVGLDVVGNAWVLVATYKFRV